jgi:nucleoside-diphosphate-sugar epimerase
LAILVHRNHHVLFMACQSTKLRSEITVTKNMNVIFGTGPLGIWTAVELLRLGQQVRLINRSGQAKNLPDNVEIRQGDAYDAKLNIEMTRDAHTIYFCAQPEYHQWAGNFPRLQAAVLQAAATNGAKLIAAENLYAYGDTHGKPLSEDTPYNAHTKKGRIRQEMTETLFAAHKAGKVRVASVRGSDFFGPLDRLYAENVFVPAMTGKAINAVGSLDQPHTFTYSVDFGKVLATIGTHDEALGQAWHVPSNAPITQRDLIKIITEEVGRPAKTNLGTPLVMRVLGLFNLGAREMVEMMYEFTQPFVMDSSKFTQTFGMNATPLRQQIRDTIASLRKS